MADTNKSVLEFMMTTPYSRSTQDKVDDFLKHFYRNIIRPEVIDRRKVLYGVTTVLVISLVGIGVGAVLYDPRLWLFDIVIGLSLLEAQFKKGSDTPADK